MSDGLFWYVDENGDTIWSFVPLPSRTIIRFNVDTDAEAIDALIASTAPVLAKRRSWWSRLASFLLPPPTGK